MKTLNLNIAAILLAGFLAGPMAYAADADTDTVDDSVDACLGTSVPESVPTTGSLGPHRYALVTLPTFDNNDNNVATPDYTITDTAGCSCEQILANVGTGPTDSQIRRGCTIETITNWVTIVDTPVITSDGGGDTANVDVPENTTAVTDVDTDDNLDSEGAGLTYSKTGGADAAKFTLNTSTGQLDFTVAPDFENPTDVAGAAAGDNVYEVQVTVTDSGGLTDTQDIDVTVTDANDAPAITSDGGGATASVNAVENQTAATTVAATDEDIPAQMLTFSITGGADSGLFSVGGASGVLTFNAAPDFESPTDTDGLNDYEVQVTVTDNGAPNLTDVQDITVSVTDESENVAPVITSDGGGATAAVNAAENQTAVSTVTATDADVPAQTLTFSITGGADSAKFSVGGASGVLTFSAPPNFENPTDAGGDNVYDVQVTVTDDGTPNLTDLQDIAVTVTDVNDAPVITSDGGGATAAVNAAENQTAVTTVSATDADVPAQTLTFSITGGADAAKFGITAGGVLTFNAAPDFENPTDAGGDNVYDVQVTVTDNGAPNLTDVQDIAVTVTDVNEAPVITSDGGGATAAVNAAENQTAVTTVSATDADVPAQTLTFSITGGADAAKFGITAGGVLTFNSAPDFENPNDDGPNGVYDVQVTVTDNGAPNLSDVQDIAVTITDVNDAPVITSDGGGATAALNAAENQTAVTTVTATDADLPAQTLTFSITGGADAAKFGITAGGVLTFNSAPDFENPNDAGLNNVYDVQVTVTDNGLPNLSDAQDIAVTVTDVAVENVAPVITSDGGGATASVSAAENQTAVTTVTATDADVPSQTLTFSITGGADSALFSIVGGTGVLTFSAAPDFEDPMDAGMNNVYDVQVTVTDNGTPTMTDMQNIAVTVTDVNDPPVITGGATAMYNAAENQSSVATVNATDPDAPAQTLTYSISGGVDSAKFGIGSTSGLLTFNSPPNFEMPADTGGNNIYDVQVAVTDNGTGMLTDMQDIAVTVTNVNDPPVGTVDGYSGAIGNTNFALVAALSGTTPVPPTAELVGTVVGNDQDEDGDTVGAVAGTVATSEGGSVTIDANGRFVYTPPAGFTGGSDTFTYTPFDGTVAGAPTTVTIAVADIVWYVDDSSPANPGTGTSGDPFRNLSSASGGPTLPGETIFVFAGTQTTGITLQANQSLVGEGLALVVGSTTLVDAGTRPVIATVGTAITLGSGNTIRGIDISGSSTGISGTAFGTLTANTMAISTTGGPGIDLTNGAGIVTFDSLSSSTSSGSGIDLDTVSGSFSLGGGSISSSSGDAVQITTSTADVSYSGTVTAGSSLAVDISGHSANSVSLSGLITSTGQGILLNNNGGGTINLSGGMSLSTGALTAFSATNGGTVNVTGTNAVTTTTATAVAIVDTTIGGSGVTFQSINSATAGTNVGIILDDTGSGTFTVAGTGGTCAVGTATCSGGRIANKTGDAVTLNNTGGRVTMTAMLIEDIGSTGGGFNTRSQHDAIHGENVSGGLTLNNTLIRRISDMCINGATFGGAFPGLGDTTWNGLDILNSTIEDCNRWHVTNTGDTSDEGAVRIVGLTGTVNIDNSTIQRAGELLDLFTLASGTLNMTVTDSNFREAYKEFSPAVSGTSVIGKGCLDVTVEGSSTANVTVGGAGPFPNNEFINCATSSIRVAKDTVPAGNSNIDVIVNNNQFRTTDQTPANGIFGNTPQGGVLLRAGPGGITTYDGIVSNNVFGVAVGPDDRIGSTTDEIGNADGVPGNLALIFESGASQARVNNNTFNGSLNAPWAHRADANASAKVLYVNNSYRGRDDYCCDGAFTFTVPGIPYVTNVRNNGALDITLRNDNFVHHDQFFFAQTETIEMNVQSSGGTLNVCLDNVTSGDGFEFDEDAGTINLYQGAVNNAATGPCVVEADGHPVSACELEVADDGVRGGPAGHAQSGGPTPTLNPPHIDIDSGSVTITATQCQEPSGGIF